MLALLLLSLAANPACTQPPPTEAERAAYQGLHAAAADGDPFEATRLILAGQNVEARDAHGRTPLLVAAHKRHHEAAQALIVFGANLDARDRQDYDALTIAAVLNDRDMVDLLLAAGANPRAITSPYRGTALIAAAHLGHTEVCRALVAAKAPIDHVNTLGWTALIEAIVLGDGGARHQATVKVLIGGGANVNLADREGRRPLALARERGYMAIAALLEQAGAQP